MDATCYGWEKGLPGVGEILERYRKGDYLGVLEALTSDKQLLLNLSATVNMMPDELVVALAENAILKGANPVRVVELVSEALGKVPEKLRRFLEDYIISIASEDPSRARELLSQLKGVISSEKVAVAVRLYSNPRIRRLLECGKDVECFTRAAEELTDSDWKLLEEAERLGLIRASARVEDIRKAIQLVKQLPKARSLEELARIIGELESLKLSPYPEGTAALLSELAKHPPPDKASEIISRLPEDLQKLAAALYAQEVSSKYPPEEIAKLLDKIGVHYSMEKIPASVAAQVAEAALSKGLAWLNELQQALSRGDYVKAAEIIEKHKGELEGVTVKIDNREVPLTELARVVRELTESGVAEKLSRILEIVRDGKITPGEARTLLELAGDVERSWKVLEDAARLGLLRFEGGLGKLRETLDRIVALAHFVLGSEAISKAYRAPNPMVASRFIEEAEEHLKAAASVLPDAKLLLAVLEHGVSSEDVDCILSRVGLLPGGGLPGAGVGVRGRVLPT